ncbi:MAG: response regulator [Paracoccaceae bacterium]
MSSKRQMRIMVVDDMATSRGQIVQALEQIGLFNTEVASDARIAFHEIAAKRVHLVISDYNMPGVDGLQLLQSLRSNAPTRGVGFILVTGRADEATVAQGRALGMNNIIRKPFTPASMKSCIEAVVGPLG